jgi:very-short-patch-repair endonuclease
LRELIDRSNGHHGLSTLKAALAELGDTSPRLRSPAEAELLALIREAALPEPRTDEILAGELVDFYWPEYRLVVEVDGRRWHGLQRDMESDRRKDVRLALAGLRPVRYTARRIASDPAGVIAELRALLAPGA